MDLHTAPDSYTAGLGRAPLVAIPGRKPAERGGKQLWKAMLNSARVAEGTRLLDVGCGAGGASLLAAEWGAEVSGTDASAELIFAARQRVPAGDFRVGHIEALPYADGAFDAIIATEIFRCGSDPLTVLLELRRVCARAGRVVVAAYCEPEFRGWWAASRLAADAPASVRWEAALGGWPDALHALLREAGLCVIASGILECPYHDTGAELLLSGTEQLAPRSTYRPAGLFRYVTAMPLHVRQGDACFDMTSGFLGDKENLTILVARAAARLPGASAEAKHALELKLGDTSVYKKPFEDSVQARETKEVEISAEVPVSATWDQAQLTLDENGKEPAVLPLYGPAPEAEYPVELQAGDKASVKSPAPTYTVSRASLDLDGADQYSAAARAPKGKRFLNLSMNVLSKDKYPALVGTENFHVLVDGASQPAEAVYPVAEALDPERSKDIQVSFLVPASTTKVELEVGAKDNCTARIPLDLGKATP